MDPSRHGVDPATDAIEVLLGVDGEIGALPDVAAQQPVEVLVGRAQPRAVGLGEENVNADRRGEIVVTGHLSSLVPGERLASLDRNPFDQLDATGENARGVVSLGKVANQIEPAGPVDERHDGRGSPCTDDEVSLEMADLAPGSGDLGLQTDQVEGTQWACLLLRRLTGSTPTLATTPLRAHRESDWAIV